MAEEVVTQADVDQELHECARYGEIDDLKMMVDSDDTGMVNFNALDASGNSALHKAAANNHVNLMQYLVEHKATYILNENKVGPLTWAVLNNQLQAVEYLLATFDDEIDVLAKPVDGLSALSTAYDVDAAEIAGLLLKHKSAAALDEMAAQSQVPLEEGEDELGEETTETQEDEEVTDKLSNMDL